METEGSDDALMPVAASLGEAPPPALAELDDVVKSYGGRRALGPVTLRLERGCIGVLGPNGAGKSTLLRLLMGLLKPTSGTVRVLGKPVSPWTRARIGYVPEGDARFPGLTGVQAVILAARLVGESRTSAIPRAHEVLDYVGLGEARYRDAETYSTGMRQRLKIAQALVHRPDLLVMDEPTEGVDPPAREDILNLIADLTRERGTQVLVSTHLLHEVERVASHAVILHDGNIIEYGPIATLRAARDRGYEVRLSGPHDALAERLRAAGHETEWVAPVLRVKGLTAPEILRHVAEAGLVARHIAPVELSLNEIFVGAVGPREEVA